MKQAELIKRFSQLEKEMQKLHKHDSLYEFEKEFVEKFEKFGQEFFEHVLSRKEKDRQKKNFKNELWDSRNFKNVWLCKSN